MKKRITELEEKIREISDTIESVYFNASWMYDGKQEHKPISEEEQEKRKKLIKKFNALNKELDMLYHIDFASSNEPVIKNDVLELYLENYEKSSNSGQYAIHKRATKEYVGNINYSGPNVSFAGNVSYSINEEHRGNHYALIALKLMCEDLHKKGVDKVYISAFKKNIPSIKTIERFGGSLIEDDGGIRRYVCDLNLLFNKKNLRG